MYVIMNASVMYAEMQLHNKKDIEIRPQDLNLRPLNSDQSSYQLSHWSSGIGAEDRYIHAARNFRKLVKKKKKKETFEGENFHRVLAGATNCATTKPTPPNLTNKTFVDSHKTSIFAKVFFLKYFLL